MGVPVKAQILILNPTISESRAADMLYQRETRQVIRNYVRPADNEITVNTVWVDHLNGFNGAQTVLYTRIGSNIENLDASQFGRTSHSECER